MDSSKINKGDIFLVNDKNKKYVSSAIDNKASLIITETKDEFDIETKQVESIYDYIDISKLQEKDYHLYQK